VKYRQERRNAVREIILMKLIGEELNAHVQSEAMNRIPEEFRKRFTEDLFLDLNQLDESRIAGLGITPDQLTQWLLKKA
jgi:hypothetical protein